VAMGSAGQIWMKISAWRGSWRVADLVRRRSLLVGGCKRRESTLEQAPSSAQEEHLQPTRSRRPVAEIKRGNTLDDGGVAPGYNLNRQLFLSLH
jgi:hypothetical protein